MDLILLGGTFISWDCEISFAFFLLLLLIATGVYSIWVKAVLVFSNMVDGVFSYINFASIWLFNPL